MPGSPRHHYEPFDARHLDRGSPKRKKVMRVRSADESLLTDVCVPPPASRIGPQFLGRPTKSAGEVAHSNALLAIMRVDEI
jgi:hypothetical protein